MSTHEPEPGYRPPVAPPGLGYVPEGYLPPTPEGRARRMPWLWLVLGVVVVVAVAAGTTAVILARRWDGRPAKGDTAITLRLTGPDGGPPSGAAVEQTKKILLSRMDQLDVTRPTVTAIGAETLLVTVAQPDTDRVRAVLVPGNLTFRKVLASTMTGGPGGAACAAGPPERIDRAAALASAKAKLGAAFDAAAAIKDPADPGAANLTGFDALTCAEVAALPPAMQYAVPAVGCAVLDRRPAGTLDDAGAQATACDDAATKYLLDVAKVAGTDLAAAEARFESQQSMWVVNLRFTATGQPRWTALTQDAMDSAARSNLQVQVAILMDNQVITAPVIQGVITGDAVITGGALGKRDGAAALAATLGHGVLPLRLVIASVETVR